jgi:hypothetical protein
MGARFVFALARAIVAARKDDPRFVPPAELDPIKIPAILPERSVELWQRGGRLHRGHATRCG